MFVHFYGGEGLKRTICIFAAVLVVLSACGCSVSKLRENVGSAISDVDSKLSDIGSEVSSAIESNVDKHDLTKDTQIIGDDSYGYMRIPNSFVKINDIEGNDNLQYSDEDGSTVFTLNRISMDVDPTKAFENLKSTLEAQGASDIEAESDVSINGFFGNRLKGYYQDEDKYVMIYLIPFTDRTAYIAVEYTEENENLAVYTQTWQPFEFING